jgi:molecular chaperone DnaK
MKGFGIDFGTTNSLIAYFSPEIAPEPGAFLDSGRPHPSLVWYKPDSTQPVVGWEARRQMNQVENRGPLLRSLRQAVDGGGT